MYYLEIVDLFDVITDVKVITKDNTVIISGIKNNARMTYDQHYQHLKVAKEVAKRLLCFKGIKKSPKKFN